MITNGQIKSLFICMNISTEIQNGQRKSKSPLFEEVLQGVSRSIKPRLDPLYHNNVMTGLNLSGDSWPDSMDQSLNIKTACELPKNLRLKVLIK